MAKEAITVKINFKFTTLILLGVIVVMLGLWRPWTTTSEQRTVSVDGQATIEATPTEFVFSPTFEETGTDQTVLKDSIATITTDVVAQIEALGVLPEDIAVNSYGGENYYIYQESSEDVFRVSSTITITVEGAELAQQVQDLLQQTEATGQLSPFPQFSTAQRAELETEARAKAIADAKQKAEQSAGLLDATIGQVITVNETTNDFIGLPYATDVARLETSDSSLPVRPGQQDYSYSVSVTFELR
jgi:uncharacterized protein YggE